MSKLCRLIRKSGLFIQSLHAPENKVQLKQVRWLNLLEYQSKVLLQENNLVIQNFRMVEKLSDIDHIADTFKVEEYVVKAQILAGGRGKGHFDNGFKGGIHLTQNANELFPIIKNMIGHNLITKQTPKKGIPVKKIMVAESVDIKRETYVCIIMDRMYNGPVLIASPAGGMDIENIAEEMPEKIHTWPIDIFLGISTEMANSVADFLNFKGDLKQKAASEIIKLWDFFLKVDATQVEINPFVETVDGKVVSVDSKIQFDDNAKFRQADIFSLEDSSETDPREIEAAKHNLNYIGLSGNIGCLVNGAGLAMATMDIIKLHGANPANFLDVGGNVNEKQVYEAFKILTNDVNVNAILVNIFGGIVNCSIIARGILNATKEINIGIPVVVRLEGTNVNEAKHILKQTKLPIILASDLEDAASKAIGCLQ